LDYFIWLLDTWNFNFDYTAASTFYVFKNMTVDRAELNFRIFSHAPFCAVGLVNFVYTWAVVKYFWPLKTGFTSCNNLVVICIIFTDKNTLQVGNSRSRLDLRRIFHC